MMMSGCGILTNGRGTRREYGEFNLVFNFMIKKVLDTSGKFDVLG